MLLLQRKANEQIRIGDTILITINKVTPSRVFIGIEAPRDVPVNREEIYKSKKLKQETNERENRSKRVSKRHLI